MNKIMSVLVLERDHLVREINREILESRGCDVIEALNAGEAYSILLNQKVDMALLGHYHDEDGPNAAELSLVIKDKWPNLPVIITVEGKVPRTYRAKQVLDKPYSRITLLQVWRQVIPRSVLFT